MTARLFAAARVLRRVLSVGAALVVLGAVAASLAAYLAVVARYPPALRAAAAQLGRLQAAQRSERVRVEAQVFPAERTLQARATLTVRSLEAHRRLFYFLLNDGLRLQHASASGGRAVAVYRLGPLLVVDLGTPLAPNGSAQLTFRYAGTPTARFAAASELDARRLLLPADSFWYPSDAQSFFAATVSVTLPRDLLPVENDPQATDWPRGDVHTVRWNTARPVTGLAVVAGAYTAHTLARAGTTYRLFLPADAPLDAARILALMDRANGVFVQRFGPSGFSDITAFVSRDLACAFNDGSGLIGVPLRAFRTGDYGFAALAGQLARDWWGATVTGKRLAADNGAAWIGAGFAGFSSLLATEAVYGEDALAHRLAGEFFDPARRTVLARPSAMDDLFTPAGTCDAVARKGAYVAMMLRRVVGDNAFFGGLRQLLEHFQYRAVTDRDVQQVLEQAGRKKLDRFFADWVRSDRLADLSLDATAPGQLTVGNLGDAAIPQGIDLWTFARGASQPVHTTVHVGDHVALAADTSQVVLDPLLVWADMQRENNRYPRRHDPVYVAAAPGGRLAVSRGEAFPWVRAVVASIDAAGHPQHTWEWSRGLVAPPAWFPDGSHLVVSYAAGDDPLPAIVVLAAGGPRRAIGHGRSPAAASDGSIFAARADRIVGFAPGGGESTVIAQPGESLDRPLPSPDGTQLVYTATRGARLQLRAVRRGGGGDRLVLSWERGRLRYRWAPAGDRLYALVGGTWDWQVWEIPLTGAPVRVLASDAAAAGDLALSPDGGALAFTAAPALDYPANRRLLYMMNLGTRAIRTIDVPHVDLGELAWADADTLFVVGCEQAGVFPARCALERVHPAEGSVEPVP